MNLIIFGTMGAGKDTVAKLYEAIAGGVLWHEIYRGKLGGNIRAEVDTVADSTVNKRELYQKYGEAMRDIFGKDHWNKQVADEFQGMQIISANEGRDISFVIADGRQMHELEYWRERGFVTVGVTAPPELRIERLKARDGVDQSEMLNHITEQRVMECFEHCNYLLDNSGSVEDLIDAVVFMVYDMIEMSMQAEENVDDSEA
jgi:dephospho-CoA kinase